MSPDTLLLRQIHPNFVQAGRVTSQAFRPTPKDEGYLSVDNGDRVQPLFAWQRYTANLNCKSAGVMAMSCADCVELSLPVIEDAEPYPYPEHCSIDFSAYTKPDIERKAKVLRSKAQLRGWLYQADTIL